MMAARVLVPVTARVPPTVALLVTASAVPLPFKVTEPWIVVVIPVRPKVIALALVVPIEIVPVVPLAVPASIVRLPELPLVTLPDCRVTVPELEVVPVVLPDWRIVLALAVEATVVLPLLTLFETKASGIAVMVIRGVISPS